MFCPRLPRFISAHGYSTIDGQTFDASDLNPSWGYAAGAITSTAEDVSTFYGALLRGTLIGKRSLQAMRTTVPVGSTAAYGLGLQHAQTSCGWFWGHDGGTFGYTSRAFVSAEVGASLSSSEPGTSQLSTAQGVRQARDASRLRDEKLTVRRVLVLLSLVASVAILAGVAGAEATTMIVSERGSLVAIALPRS